MPRIESDLNRFRQIVRGRVREELKHHLGRQELIGKQGDRLIAIPVPHLELPRFAHDYGGKDVAQGPAPQGGEGRGAGDEPGKHILDAEFTVEELAHMLGEALELPRIRPKGHDALDRSAGRYSGIASAGPESLRHFRRSYRQALRRLLVSGAYDPRRPRVALVHADRRYRAFKPNPQPRANAAILYVMDVSGSMGDEQKEIVRIESFWIDAWIRSHYRGVRTVFLVHDVAAKEVDRELFFRLHEAGGTAISSAYELAARVIKERFPPDDWNLYLLQFTDGENFSRQDTEKCLDVMAGAILPALNLFGYVQVEVQGSHGDFYDALHARLHDDERVALSRVPDRDSVVDSIRALLGRGR